MIRYFILLLLIDVVYSCGVCFGDPNSSAVDGMNWAIISLFMYSFVHSKYR